MSWRRVIEVEVKCEIADYKSLIKRLAELGGRFKSREFQEDTYYNTRTGDFARTDEALRLRKVGEKTFLTYKGPKKDAKVKVREEYEVAVENPVTMDAILRGLGFSGFAEVRKERDHYLLGDVWVLVDRVEGLGEFVEYNRIEIICADELVDPVVAAIEQSANTGLHGDGKIYVLPVEQAVRISTGERGEDAV